MEQTKYIYIMLSNTFSWTTRAIGLYTKAPYNHVSLALDEHLHEMYSFGRRYPEWALPGGFVQEKQREGTFPRFKDTICAIYRLEVSDSQYMAIRSIIAEFQKEQGSYNFNLIGFAGLAAGLPIERRYAYFCSQFVATVLSRAGVKLVDKPPGLVKPSDFPESGRLTLIYEGKLADYEPCAFAFN
jgi:hypothetical protein